MRQIMRLTPWLVSLILTANISWAQSIRTTDVSFGSSNAILMEPMTPGPESHIAIVYACSGANNFNPTHG